MNISIEITGNKEFMTKLEGLSAGMDSFESALKTTGIELVNFTVNQVFNSKGGALSGMKGSSQGGVPWAKLSANTLLARKKGYGYYGKDKTGDANASQILRWSDTMRHSFYWKASSKTLEIGNTADYFKYHQSDADRTRLPRRPMLGVNKTVVSMVKKIIVLDLRQKMGIK